jgi:hypothetical protein
MQPQNSVMACLLLLSLATLGFLPCRSAAGMIATSDFSVNDEGWRLSGDVTSAIPSYSSTGGNPGGFIRGFDSVVGGVWYWDAPKSFLGNVTQAYDSSLSFDLRMRGSGPLFSDSDVILDGAELSLHLATTPPVPLDQPWTSYSVLLSETAGWRAGSLAGETASKDQMLAVLSSLDRLRIRGEFITGADNGDLDNVVLNGASEANAAPEPGSLLLLGLGGAISLLTSGYRRGKHGPSGPSGEVRAEVAC